MPLLVAAASLCACAPGFPRKLTYRTLTSSAMDGRAMAYSVYTPPGFGPEERLPLVVFLHGGGDDPSSFDRWGLPGALDRAIAEGDVPRVVVVVPQGDLGFWANWYDGSHRYEDWVIHDLVPRVARDYHTSPCPGGCHVMGVSMGGSGALRFALHHPRLWSSATIISAPILDTDQMIAVAQDIFLGVLIPLYRIWGPATDRALVEPDDPYLRWRRPGDLGQMRLMVAWAHRDRGAIVQQSQRFVRHLARHGVSHERLEFDGGHSWVSWRPVILEALATMVGSRCSRCRPDR